MSYGLKYQLEYKDQILEGAQGRKTTIKILEKDYSGSVTEVNGGPDPLVISASSDNDYMFTSIIGSSAKITLMATNSQQFENIFGANARQYLVEVWKEPTPNATQTLFWTGYVVPDNFSEPLHDYTNYPVTIEAIDGLARFQYFEFLNDAGLKYSGKLTALDWIREILFKTGLSLSYRIALSWDEIYSTGTYPALFTKYLDADTFYFKDTPKCDYVLEQILQSFGARIIQNKGYWVIKEVTKNTGTHTVYKSDFTTETYNPVKAYSRARNYDRLVFINKEGIKTSNPAYKYFQINHDFLLKDSLLKNPSFENWTKSGSFNPLPSQPDYDYAFDNWVQNPNNIRFLKPITEPGYDGYYLKMFGIYGSPNYSQYIESNPIAINLNGRETLFTMSLRKAHFNAYFEIKIGGKWVNNSGQLQASVYRFNTSSITAVNEFVTFELNIEGTSDTGNLSVRIYRPYFGGTPNQTVRPFFFVDNINFKYQNSEVTDKISFEIDVDENNNYIPDEINSILGDVPNVADREDIYLGTFWRYDGINYIPTLYWQNELGEQATILQLLANLILDTHYKPKQYLTGLRLKGNFDFDSSLQVNFLDNRIYLPINYEYHDKYAEWVIDCVEVLADRLLATNGGDYIVTNNGDFIKV